MRYKQVSHLSLFKTLCKPLPIDKQSVNSLIVLAGNDLKTSKVLYFTLFCIETKERFLCGKDTTLQWIYKCQGITK